MLFFAVTPILIKFVEEEILITEFENNSRKVMVYKLSGKTKPSTEKEEDFNKFNEKDLLSDILVLNELENNSVRLNAPTIIQLFKDTKYNLEDVRTNKLVRPVALTWLPYEIKKIQNTKDRKDLFIQIILPLILEENNNIKLERFKSVINYKPLEYKKILPEEKKLNSETNPPNLLIEFFDEQTNIQNISCYSNDGGNWNQPNLIFTQNFLKVEFKEKFVPRRGRINCSLNDKGDWRWFGTQFTIRD